MFSRSNIYTNIDDMMRRFIINKWYQKHALFCHSPLYLWQYETPNVMKKMAGYIFLTGSGIRRFSKSWRLKGKFRGFLGFVGIAGWKKERTRSLFVYILFPGEWTSLSFRKADFGVLERGDVLRIICSERQVKVFQASAASDFQKHICRRGIRSDLFQALLHSSAWILCV